MVEGKRIRSSRYQFPQSLAGASVQTAAPPYNTRGPRSTFEGPPAWLAYLDNVIQRAIVPAHGPELQLQDFPLEVATPHAGARFTEDTRLPLKDARSIRTAVCAASVRSGAVERERNGENTRSAPQHHPDEAYTVGPASPG